MSHVFLGPSLDWQKDASELSCIWSGTRQEQANRRSANKIVQSVIFMSDTQKFRASDPSLIL